MNPVERYIYNYKDETLQVILQEIHFLIINTLPEVQYSIKWHMPYYSHQGLLCYLHAKKNKVNIGFHAGVHFSNEQGILSGQHLKQIRHIEVESLDSMPVEGIIEVLQEAARWNEGDNQLRKKE